PEEGSFLAFLPSDDAAIQPARRSFHRSRDIVDVRVMRGTLVERHCDIGSQRLLHLDRKLGRQVMAGAVVRAGEENTLLGDLSKLGERENLKPAAVGED